MENRSVNSTLRPRVIGDQAFESFHIACIILGVAIVIINATVIYLYLTRKSLRTSIANIFLLNMAISDLCFGALALPTVITCEMIRGDACLVNHFFLRLTGFCTIYLILMGITEKYFAICHTIWHYTHYTLSLAVKLCLSVWLVALIIAHIPLWWLRIFRNRNPMIARWFNYFYIVMGFVIPVVASAFMYTMMFRVIKKQTKRMTTMSIQSNKQQHKRLRDERKTALIFGIMFTLFLLCWASWFTLTAFYAAIRPSTSVIDATVICRYMAAILNPVLYTFTKPDFRAAFMSLRRCGRQRALEQGSFVSFKTEKQRLQGDGAMLESGPF